jgi:hypothetical protein
MGPVGTNWQGTKGERGADGEPEPEDDASTPGHPRAIARLR